TYGDLDGIFAHADEQTPKLRANLIEHEARARRNAEVMVLRRDVPVDVTPAPLSADRIDPEAVRSLFDFLEFHSLSERLAEAMGGEVSVASPSGEVVEAEVTVLDTAADAVRVLDELRTAPDAAFPLASAAAWVGAEGKTPLLGVALVTDSALAEVAWIPEAVLTDP